MSIIQAAIDRGRPVIISMFVLLLVGFQTYRSIPKELFPDVTIPFIYVSVSLSGVSPEDAERLIVRPLEKRLRTIDGLKKLEANAYLGGSNIMMEFDAGFDPERALEDVKEEVDEAKRELPNEIKEPFVGEINVSEFPIIVATVSGDLPLSELNKVSRELKSRIEAIPEVIEVKLRGNRTESVEIIIDPASINSYKLTPGDLISLGRRFNLLVAAGQLQREKSAFAVKVPGLLEEIDDIMSLPVASQGDSVVTLGEIASVRRTFKDAQSYARLNGSPSIALEVVKRSGENLLDTTKKIRDVSQAFLQEQRDSAIAIDFTQDQSRDVIARLSDLENNMLVAVIIVMILILSTLGIGSGLLVALSIPGSFFIGLIALSQFNASLNIIVLFALLLSVGMLVDGAVIIAEFAERRLNEGKTPVQAYSAASRIMCWPIITSIATTLAAFFPLLVWPGVIGEIMRFFPLTLIFVLSASLLMALVFIPVTAIYLNSVLRICISVLLAALGAIFGSTLTGMVFSGFASNLGLLLALPVFVFSYKTVGLYIAQKLGHPPQAEDDTQTAEPSVDLRPVAPSEYGRAYEIYYQALGWIMKRKRNAIFTLVLSLVAVVMTFVGYGMTGRGAAFFPSIEPDQIILSVQAVGNYSVNESDDLVREVEEIVLELARERAEIRSVNSTSGLVGRAGSGNDIIGMIMIELSEWQKRRTADDILAELIRRSERLPGLRVLAAKSEAGPPTGKPFQVTVVGADFTQIDQVVEQIRQWLLQNQNVFGVEDTRMQGRIEYVISVDRSEAQRYGADTSLLGQFVRLVTSGLTITSFRPDDSDEEIDIIVRLPSNLRTLSQLEDLRILTQLGEVPVANFISVQPQESTSIIKRINTQRAQTIQADVLLEANANAEIASFKKIIPDLDIPPEVELILGGQSEDQAETSQFLMVAFLTAIGIMLVLMLIQFNSLYQTFVVLSAVLLSTSGVMFGLLMTGRTFNIVMSGMGVVALAGLIVNNNIVLIDMYNRIRSLTDDKIEAIKQTAMQRTRPVLLTALTAALGLLPMVLEVNVNLFDHFIEFGGPSTQWWVDLSTGIFFGLLIGTLLTLVVTPTMLYFGPDPYPRLQQQSIIRRVLNRDRSAEIAAKQKQFS